MLPSEMTWESVGVEALGGPEPYVRVAFRQGDYACIATVSGAVLGEAKDVELDKDALYDVRSDPGEHRNLLDEPGSLGCAH